MNGHFYLGYLDYLGAETCFLKDKNRERGAEDLRKMLKQRLEIKHFEEHEFELPKFYKAWCLANKISIYERPPSYVYAALKARNQLLRILNNKEWFILANPERTLIDCNNLLDDVIQTYKLMV